MKDSREPNAPTWENQLTHAIALPDSRLRPSALTSTRSYHRCKDCFCCAALTVLEERHPGLTPRKLEAMEGN